ncbi:MAG: hypothetical protein ACLQVI_35140 [Polyangiaceae bacterium]
MYAATLDPRDALEQGDICRDVPLPVVTAAAQLINIKTSEWFGEPGSPISVPDRTVLESKGHVCAVVPMVRAHLVVLSQSCDLLEAEGDENARLLVAPVRVEEDDRLSERYAAAVKAATEGLPRKITASMKNPTQTSQVLLKAGASIEEARSNALKQLWLGEIVGALPLQANEGAHLARSVCYFDNAVSLPASWIPILKEQRVLRLTFEWQSVLREALMLWLGRYAFPGSKNDRLRVGGLGVPVASAPPSAPPSAPAPAPPEVAAPAPVGNAPKE